MTPAVAARGPIVLCLRTASATIVPMQTLTAAHVQLRCFPSDDEQFVEHVHAAAARLSSDSTEPAREALERQITARYPHASVHVRSSLAELYPDEPTWYVFRDGRA